MNSDNFGGNENAIIQPICLKGIRISFNCHTHNTVEFVDSCTSCHCATYWWVICTCQSQNPHWIKMVRSKIQILDKISNICVIIMYTQVQCGTIMYEVTLTILYV